MPHATYVILFPNGAIELIQGTAKEAMDYAFGISEKFTLYEKGEYEAEFGPLTGDDAKTHLQKKMESSEPSELNVQNKPEQENTPDPYRQTIIDTFQLLREMGDQVFSQAVNLAMENEWKELNEKFDEEDTVKFNIEDLEQLNDPNVQKLVELINSIDATMSTLENINDLGIEEKEG